MPRIRSVEWDDAEDDPLSIREGKWFNRGAKAAADELQRALKQLEALTPPETK